MKPLLCFDIESTGPDPATDRIVEIAWCKRLDDGTERNFRQRINPQRPIPPEVVEIIKITDGDVESCPPFSDLAATIHGHFTGCDLLGFNLTNFDVPILWEEFARCGIEWDLSDARILDAGTLFKRREPRTLTAAMAFYCDDSHEDAHTALADVLATVAVWDAQVERYGLDPSDRDLLQQESNYEEVRVDLAGKIVLKDGVPVYNFGKSKGVPVVDDPGFGSWILGKDFTENTKMHLRKILDAPF